MKFTTTYLLLFFYRKSIALAPVKEDSGKNSKVCSNKNVNISIAAKKGRNQRIETKIVTRTSFLVSVNLIECAGVHVLK